MNIAPFKPGNLSDNSESKDAFTCSVDKYIHNCNFLYENSKDKNIQFKGIPMDKVAKITSTRGANSSWIADNTAKKCSITNSVSKEGISGNILQWIQGSRISSLLI